MGKNTILLSINGTIGSLAKYKNEKCILGKSAAYININNENSQDFVYYLMLDSRFQRDISKNANGSTIKNVSLAQLRNYSFTLPPFPEQRAIAAVLSSLDDKIELLREQNKTLEAVAQAIFKEWLVKFNFPNATGKMIDSALGKIPERWRVGKLGDVVEIFDSRRVPLASDVRAKRKGKHPYYGATEIMDYIDDYLFGGTFLLLAEDGSVTDSDGYVVLQYVTGKFWVNNHAHVLQGKDEFSTEILYLFCKRLKAAAIITGAVQPKINQANLLGVELPIPNKKVLVRLNQTLQPVFQKIISNNSQIQTLSKLRDALLPKLMSGKLRVNNKNV